MLNVFRDYLPSEGATKPSYAPYHVKQVGDDYASPNLSHSASLNNPDEKRTHYVSQRFHLSENLSKYVIW